MIALCKFYNFISSTAGQILTYFKILDVIWSKFIQQKFENKNIKKFLKSFWRIFSSRRRLRLAPSSKLFKKLFEEFFPRGDGRAGRRRQKTKFLKFENFWKIFKTFEKTSWRIFFFWKTGWTLCVCVVAVDETKLYFLEHVWYQRHEVKHQFFGTARARMIKVVVNVKSCFPWGKMNHQQRNYSQNHLSSEIFLWILLKSQKHFVTTAMGLIRKYKIWHFFILPI